MKKRTMLVAGLGAAGALFLSVHAWTASAAPVSTPVPDRCMSFIDENDNGVCDNKENGTYAQQPNCVKEGNADGNGICSSRTSLSGTSSLTRESDAVRTGNHQGDRASCGYRSPDLPASSEKRL